MLICKPHQSTNGSTSKLIQPWRGPYIICSIVLPVVYQIRLPDDTNHVCIHLADIKPYRPRKSSFMRKILPTSDLDEIEPVLPHVGIYEVADIVGHQRGLGRHSSHNFICRLPLKGFGSKADLEYQAPQVPQVKTSLQHIELRTSSTKSRLLLSTSGNISPRKTVVSWEAVSQ